MFLGHWDTFTFLLVAWTNRERQVELEVMPEREKTYRSVYITVPPNLVRQERPTFLWAIIQKYMSLTQCFCTPCLPCPITTIGDIDIIAAMGDSLTAATGATSTAFMDLFMDNRGLSWCIGGQWTYRNSSTLPNILKEFNPNLFGYSVADSYPFHLASQFNVAEIGSVSADMVYMARTLIRRIRNDPRVDFKRHWKMVTISIGEFMFYKE